MKSMNSPPPDVLKPPSFAKHPQWGGGVDPQKLTDILIMTLLTSALLFYSWVLSATTGKDYV